MTERKREVAALCTVCWTECGYQEELTPSWLGPHQCRRCGKVCQKQGRDFHVVWYPPPNRPEQAVASITATEIEWFGEVKRAHEELERQRRAEEDRAFWERARKPKATPPLEVMLNNPEYSVAEVSKRRQEIVNMARCGDNPNYDQICSYYVRDLLWLIEQLLRERNQ